MKALAFILLGTIGAAFSGMKLMDARAADSSTMGAIWFVGIVAGVVIAFIGLMMNHGDHTKRR